MTVVSRGTSVQGGIVDDESISLGEERHRCCGLVLSGIPGDGTRRAMDCLVHGERVRGLIRSTSGDDIDSGGSDRQTGEVPGKGKEVADLVVGRRRLRVGSQHGQAAKAHRSVVRLGVLGDGCLA